MGNILVIDIKISTELTLRIINIYGPNKDNPEFFCEIENYISNNPSDYLIICGDLNVTLNPQKDSENYSTSNNNPKSRQKILELIDNYDLIDIFRHLHPDEYRFTWKKTNSIKQLVWTTLL